jgi:hypothetical protein
MKCKNCEHGATRHFDHSHHLCDRCFAKVIEHRIRKSIGSLGIKVNDTVFPADEISEYAVKKFINFPIKISSKKTRNSKTIAATCLDTEIASQLNSLMYNKKPKKDKARKLFTDITYEDLLYYCNIKRIRFEMKIPGETFNFVETINKKHPGIKNTFLRTTKELSSKKII